MKLVLNKRPYASYFHFSGDQRGTEISVFDQWVCARHPSPSKIYSSWTHCVTPNDPPDLIATTLDGRIHGFEVTELVDPDTIRRIDRNDSFDFKEYTEQELTERIRQIVERKSDKKFKSPCDKAFLLIYSDEPDLFDEAGVELLSKVSTPKSSQFREIWFMIPPEVNISGGEPKNPNCQIFLIRQH